MSDVPFYRTLMGQRFYEATVPSLVRELGRLNQNLERILAAFEEKPQSTATATAESKPEKPR